MRKLLIALVVPFAVVVTVGAAGAATAADDVPVTGSWTQLRVATPLGDSPDLQSQDGPALPVENGPAGVIAFSAVRWTKQADLTLARVDTAAAASAPTIWACPATAWPAGDRQPWSERPAVDCARHVEGRVSADRIAWRTSDLGGPVNVVLVPAPGDTSSFSVSFGAPTVDSFTVPRAPSPAAAPVLSPPVTAPEPEAPAGLPAVVRAVRQDLARPVPAVRPLLEPAPAPAPVPGPVLVAADRDDHAAWPGQLLLVLLSLLVIAKAAFPVRPADPPVSLVAAPRS